MNLCVSANPDPAALLAEWQAAQAKLGAPFTNAGQPDIQPLSPPQAAHVQRATTLPWIAPSLAHVPQPFQFALAEIDPLLAFQTLIDVDRSGHHCGQLNGVPSDDELVEICFPTAPPNEQISVSRLDHAVMLKAKGLNIRIQQHGLFQQIGNLIGIQFGLSLPFVHVVRFNGRHYLHNGFHRALGIRMAGGTHVACLLRDVHAEPEIGLGGNTFQLPLLEGPNPPTLGHYSQGRAYNVQVRAMARVLHVSWAEHGVPDE